MSETCSTVSDPARMGLDKISSINVEGVEFGKGSSRVSCSDNTHFYAQV